MAADGSYTDQEWKESAGHRPLRDVDVNQVFLLNRHWIWANLQRGRFSETLATAPPPDDGAFLGDVCWASLYLWYALLWSVIEALSERGIELRGRFSEDISRLSSPLRRCRNVVFHVSEKNQNDVRLFEIMQEEDSAASICRISTGFGRLFIEESAARKAEGRLGS